MLRFRIKEEQSVGLDIGSYAIKVSCLEKKFGENTLTSYNIKNIPRDTANISIEKLIGESFREIEIRPETVNLSISGSDVIVRFIILPKMNEQQLENALSFEAEKYIPFNINEVVLDFVILGDTHEAGHMQVLLAAVKRNHTEELVRIMEKLGVSVDIIDIAPFAMFNAFLSSNPSSDRSKGTAFLDLGHSQSSILISSGETPCFMRQVQIGGKNITDAIVNGLSVSREKAEEYKNGLEDENRAVVEQIIRTTLDDLVRETQLSFGYFETKCNKGIDAIYSSGGMVYQKGVIDYLSEKLAIKVKSWNPLQGLKISENLSRQDIDSIASQLAVSIGLALRG